MITEQKTVYKAFGLRIASEMELPELPVRSSQDETAEIEIRIVRYPADRAELEETPYKHVVQGNEVSFFIPDTAFFSVRDGKTIAVSPLPNADKDLVRLYILGTCMGALLMQRRVYPLHGSAVAVGGRAYAFIGESGAGKSTLASAFLSEGYPLVSDDLIAVSLSPKDQAPYVTPAYPQQKLWQDSLAGLGMESGDYRSIYGRETKYSVPVSGSYYSNPLPLAGVFELVPAEDGQVSVAPIGKLERLPTLFNHTFRQFLLPRLGLMEWHFATSASLVDRIGMYRLKRPTAGFTAPALVRLILDLLPVEGSE